MDDVEDPKSTEDAVGLLADADSHLQLAQEWEATAPAAAASYHDKAQRLLAAATAFLKLPDAPAVGAGGELGIREGEIGEDWGLKETVDNPGRDTVGASRARLGLLVDTDTVNLGIDAAATIDARNSLEKMLAHQMAAAHRMSMKFLRRAEQELWRQNDPEAVLEANRCTNAAARMMKAYQEGLLALGRMRTGGRQVVTVQHVQVSDGGQAIVAGAVNGSSRGPRAEGGAMNEADEPHADGWRRALRAAREVPPCGARTRSGMPCRGAAMANGRCRMHGGPSTGPRTPEGLERSRRANWKHGRKSAEAMARRKEAAAIRREIRRLIALMPRP